MRTLLVLLLAALPISAQENTGDHTLVVIYRPSKHVGRAATPSVFIDGRELARLDNGRFFSIYLKPGSYLVQALNSMHNGGLVTKFTVSDSPVYIRGDFSTYRDAWFEVAEPAAAVEEIKSVKPLDKKWVRDDRVVFDLEPKTKLTAEAP